MSSQGDHEFEYGTILVPGGCRQFLSENLTRGPGDLQMLAALCKTLEVVILKDYPALLHGKGFKDTVSMMKRVIGPGQTVSWLTIYPAIRAHPGTPMSPDSPVPVVWRS
jgi:hypothetical protein